MSEQVRDVGLLAREEVVEADDVMALGDKSFTQVRPEKTSSAGHKNAFDLRHVTLPIWSTASAAFAGITASIGITAFAASAGSAEWLA
jgi:hypothetical protein